MHTAASYLPIIIGFSKRTFSRGVINWLYVSIFKMYCAYIYICVCVCVCLLFQNCFLLKDSRIFPCIFSTKDFGSKTIDTGVSLHVATSKRDSMWHSPDFTSIRANRIPVKGIKRTAVRNYEMQVDLPSHSSYRPLHLIKIFMDTLQI